MFHVCVCVVSLFCHANIGCWCQVQTFEVCSAVFVVFAVDAIRDHLCIDLVILMCLFYVSLRSKLRLNILLLICKLRLVSYSIGPGVKSVRVIFSVLSMKLFDLFQA